MVKIKNPILIEILNEITKEIEKAQKELDVIYSREGVRPTGGSAERNAALERLRNKIKNLANEM